MPLPRNVASPRPLLLLKELALKPRLGLRNFRVSAAVGDVSGEQNNEDFFKGMISQYKLEASSLRQELLKPGCSDTGIQTKKLWQYMLVSTKLEDLRDAHDALDKLTVSHAEKQVAIMEKMTESKSGCCSEDIDNEDTNDDGFKGNEDPKDEVGNSATSVNINDDDNNNAHRMDNENPTDSNSNPQTHNKDRIRKALAAVEEGHTMLVNGHYDAWKWLQANETNRYIPLEFWQMMEQQCYALGKDRVRTLDIVRAMGEKL